MIKSIIDKVKELLKSEDVKVVIGYAEGSDGATRAHFAMTPESADQFIYDERCDQNLAVYLTKGEVKSIGKPCIIADLSALRSILQIASENQLKEEDVVVLGIDGGKLTEFKGFEDIEKYVASANLDIPAEDKAMIEKLEAMSAAERWEFWTNQFSKCIKCYACRSSCPKCYCSRCQVEFNQPQLITVEATPMGNFEWHTMRAMHLAGRCVNCGACGRACPMDIPIHLLNFKTVSTIKNKFDATAGTSAELESVMSHFNPGDKEDFILQE